MNSKTVSAECLKNKHTACTSKTCTCSCHLGQGSKLRPDLFPKEKPSEYPD